MSSLDTLAFRLSRSNSIETESLLTRGQRLKDIEAGAKNLESRGSTFTRTAVKAKRKLCLENAKMSVFLWLTIICCVICFLLLGSGVGYGTYYYIVNHEDSSPTPVPTVPPVASTVTASPMPTPTQTRSYSQSSTPYKFYTLSPTPTRTSPTPSKTPTPSI